MKRFIFLIAFTILSISTYAIRGGSRYSHNIYDYLEIFPVSIIIGIPLMLFGAMFYYIMRENGRNACLITSSIYLAGIVSVLTTLVMPVESNVFGMAIFMGILGAFLGNKIFKDLKARNYL